jgi:predicted transcriptional regulator
MTTETEAQRQARLDREASRNYRTTRFMRRSAIYRRAEEHEEWKQRQADAAGTAPKKPEDDKA